MWGRRPVRQEPTMNVEAQWFGKTIGPRTLEGLESELYLVNKEEFVVKCSECKNDTSRLIQQE